MITERMQCNLIYRAFIAKEPLADIDVASWSEPWRTIALLADRPNANIIGLDSLGQAINAVADDDEHARHLRYLIEQAATPMHLPSLLEIAANLPPVEWLWKGWIPRGLLSLIGAYQGTGKSWFVLDLARIIIAGDKWPDGSGHATPGPIVYVDAEGIPSILNERAVALGVDRRQLYLMFADPGAVFDLAKPEWRDKLIDAVMTVHPALVLIDALSSITSKGQNSVEDTNDLFAFLVGLARHANCGMTLIHHLRKPPSGQLHLPGMSIHDFRGSGHITAMPRVVMGMSVVQTGKQFSLNGARRLEVVKTNLGPYPEPLVAEMTTSPDETVVSFAYGAIPTDRTETTSGSVEEWLIAYLEDNGATKPAVVVEAAAEQGYGRTIIYRARKALDGRIKNTAGYQNPKNCWELADEQPDDESFDESEDE